jgi:hypothetical protein
MSSQENIFNEKDGDTNYSIVKGVFFIPDLKAKMSAFRVMKHTNYSKPIVEYCFEKVKAETVLKELMQVDKPLYHFDKSVLQK